MWFLFSSTARRTSSSNWTTSGTWRRRSWGPCCAWRRRYGTGSSWRRRRTSPPRPSSTAAPTSSSSAAPWGPSSPASHSTSMYVAHMRPVLVIFHWLSMRERQHYKMAILADQGRVGLLPRYLSTLLSDYKPARTLPSGFGAPLLQTRRVRNELARRFFGVAVPAV